MQLELALTEAPEPRGEDQLVRELETLTGFSLRLQITDNSRTVMSMTPGRTFQGRQVRLHHMFLEADEAVVRAVAAWIKKPKSTDAGRIIDAYIRANRHRMRKRARRTIYLETTGLHHDLQAMFDAVNREQFDGTITAAITWGRSGFSTRRYQRTMRFGSYTVDLNLIRIHPALDQAFVPAYFVKFIVFHEMLHAHLGIEESETGRRKIHTRAFLAQERAYPDYARATKWEKNASNLKKLLRT
ncbi:MAG TPA: hypothetical protein PLJ47_04750 [Candidatus Hydrogenedentes bacterium]|nr:hypothetical protein [Candidatus Hydrogenedentota bacterium]